MQLFNQPIVQHNAKKNHEYKGQRIQLIIVISVTWHGCWCQLGWFKYSRN